MVDSSVGYLLEISARRWCQMGSLEPFEADIYWIYQKVSVDL